MNKSLIYPCQTRLISYKENSILTLTLLILLVLGFNTKPLYQRTLLLYIYSF